MGLLTSVNNINYKLEEEKKAREEERKAKEKERQKAKEKKIIQERIKKEIDSYLQSIFKKCLFKNGSFTVYEFYNIEKKEIILKNILSQYTIIKTVKTKTLKAHDIEYIEHKEFIIEYFNKIYYKILKQAEEEAKKNEEYKIYAQLTTPKKEEHQQEAPTQPIKKEKHIDFNKVNKVINIIFTIILIVLFFPIAILIAACKNQK